MDEFEASEFFEAMRGEDPRILDLVDAYTLAMESVTEFDGPRWFGPIQDGTFYADNERVLWYAETKPYEALSEINVTYGPQLTDGFERLYQF